MNDNELLQAIRGIIKEEIREELAETKQILRALEHSAEVNKSAYDAMQNNIAHIKGNIAGLKEKMLTFEIEMRAEIEDLKDKTLTIEAVTIDNWKDIVKMKLTKQQPQAI